METTAGSSSQNKRKRGEYESHNSDGNNQEERSSARTKDEPRENEVSVERKSGTATAESSGTGLISTVSKDTSTLFASIFLPLVEHACISASEVCKLALVCKTVNRASMNDGVWAVLCTRDYPCTHEFASEFKERKEYREIYKLWCAPLPKRPRLEELPPLPSPHGAEHMTTYTNIKYDGKSIYSVGNPVDDMALLLREGGCGLTFETPIVLGKAKWNFTEQQRISYIVEDNAAGLPVTCHGFDRKKLEMSMHLHREIDQCTVCIFRSQNCRARSIEMMAHPKIEDDAPITNQSKFDLAKDEPQYGCLELKQLASQERLPFKDTKEAAQVERRLPYPVHLGAELLFGIVGTDDFAMTELYYWALWNDVVNNGRLEEYNSDEEAKKHGVTLLHILSHLSG